MKNVDLEKWGRKTRGRKVFNRLRRKQNGIRLRKFYFFLRRRDCDDDGSSPSANTVAGEIHRVARVIFSILSQTTLGTQEKVDGSLQLHEVESMFIFLLRKTLRWYLTWCSSLRAAASRWSISDDWIKENIFLMNSSSSRMPRLVSISFSACLSYFHSKQIASPREFLNLPFLFVSISLQWREAALIKFESDFPWNQIKWQKRQQIIAACWESCE